MSVKRGDSMQIGLPVHTEWIYFKDSGHTRDRSMGPTIIIFENSRLEVSTAGLDKPLDHAQSDSPGRARYWTLKAPHGTFSTKTYHIDIFYSMSPVSHHFL